MQYNVIFSICMIVSTAVEIYLVTDFYKAFHPKRKWFVERGKERILAISVIALNTFVSLMNNNFLNFVITAFLYLFVGLALVEGNIWSKLFHWIILIFVVFSSKLIFAFLPQVSVNRPANERFENEFVMINRIIAMILLEFLLLAVIKQASEIRVKKISGKMFGCFVTVPVAGLGLMAVIPYIREEGKELSSMDFVVLLFLLLLVCGTLALFYVFTKYSQLQEERMMREVSQTKYEERRQRHEKEGDLEQKYKEHIHDIKYYLKQIGIYMNEKRFDEIKDVLEELQVGIYQEEKNIVCANHFLNAIFVDLKGEAQKKGVETDIFVEAGFKIEYMKEIDITVIMGNLLDNALEAAAKCRDGKIWVNLYMQNQGNLAVFSIKNTYTEKIVKKGNTFLTTKKEKWGHGIGLQSVSHLVDSYNGYMQQDFDENTYEVIVIIPVKSEK